MDDRQRQIATHYRASLPAFLDVWAPVLAGLARPILDRLPLGEVSGVLEIGCGAGHLLRELMTRAPAGARIVGADILPEMLAAARGAAPGAHLVRLDAARLPFADRSFDLVLSAFTWHHVREQRRAFGEIQRVLAPGGRLALVTWGNRDHGCPALQIWEDLLAEFGAPEDDPDPPPVWSEAIDTPGKLEAILRQAGFAEVDIRPGGGTWQWRAAELVRYRIEMGDGRRRIEKLPPARRAAFAARARAAVGGLQTPDLAWRPDLFMTITRKPEGPTSRSSPARARRPVRRP